MKKILLVIFLATFSCLLSSHAEISPEKRAEIEKMLRLTGTLKLMDQMKVQVMNGFKKQMTNVPDAVWVKVQDKFDTRELLDKIIPLYDKYYTIDDLKAVNAFYESPAGQKVLANLPQIMQESLEIGREWGVKIGKQVVAEIKRESQNKQ